MLHNLKLLEWNVLKCIDDFNTLNVEMDVLLLIYLFRYLFLKQINIFNMDFSSLRLKVWVWNQGKQ